MNLQNITRYFRSCYEADNRETGILNFLGSKVTHRYWMEGDEELANVFLPFAPVTSNWGSDAGKALAIHASEKELMYGSLFLLGQVASGGISSGKVCLPVFLYPAKLEQRNTDWYITIDHSKRRLNPSLVDLIRSTGEAPDDIYSVLEKGISKGQLANDADVSAVAQTLDKLLPGIDSTPLIDYPKLYTKRKLQAAYATKKIKSEGKLLLVPASSAGVVKKSTDTLGVLTELKALAERERFSQPLRYLFEKLERTGVNDPDDPSHLPIVLSAPQQKILESAIKFPVNVVIGPPGTGKSFTIASLAVEHIGRGKSVLVVSRTDQAVDVVTDKIKELAQNDDIVVRGGKSQYLKELKGRLDTLMKRPRKDAGWHNANIFEAMELMQTTINRLKELETQFTERANEELSWGQYLKDEPASAAGTKVASALQRNRMRYLEWKVARDASYATQLRELEQALQNKNELASVLIAYRQHKKQDEAVGKRWTELKDFQRAIRARNMTTLQERFNRLNSDAFLSAFPIWCVSLSDVSRVLPFIPELFDLVIIDEATQCDIAACLPALQRAKHAVIAGDPDQLRHVSFLSRDRQRVLMNRAGIDPPYPDQLNYREWSMLDLAEDALMQHDQVAFLDEHYRSHPPIIGFSNTEIYNSSIHIMTDKPGQDFADSLLHVPADGERDAQGRNAQEAALILQEIERVIDEQKALPDASVHSLGLLSPFRAQVDYLSKLVTDRLTTTAIQRHRIAVGTAYSFQGEERDRMYLSFALTDGDHPSAFHYMNRSDVFNVAVTRARIRQEVYASFGPEKLPAGSLVRNFFEHLATPWQPETPKSNAAHDAFAESVKHALENERLQVLTAYPMAGMVLDLVVIAEDNTAAIDLIGFPGDFEAAFSMDRYRMLSRAGLRIFPLPYTKWYFDLEGCVEELLEWIKIGD